MSAASYVDHRYPRAVERLPEIRQSTLGAFDNCGLSSFFDLEFRRGWSTDYQGRGQLFHRFAGEALRTMVRMGEDQIPVGEALAILREVIRQDGVDRECPTCGTRQIEPGIEGATGLRRCRKGHEFETDLVNVPIAMARDLHWIVVKWAHENAFDTHNLVDVEQRLRAKIRYDDGQGGTVERTLTGQIDALFIEGVSRAIVLDWKDTWATPGPTEVSFAGYFQQRFYAWLVFRNYPTVEEVVLREFYVRYSEPREAVVSRRDEPEIESELSALAERFDRSWDEQITLEEERGKSDERWAFRPTPGKHCSFCTRPTACPIAPHTRGPGRIESQAEAERAAKQLIAADEAAKKTREALRVWTNVHGPIAIADAKGKRALGYVEEVRTRRPGIEEIEQLARELGRPPTPAEIKGLYKTTRGTKFRAHVPAGVDEAASTAVIEEQLRASIEAARARMKTDGVGNVVELRPRRKRPEGPSGVRPRVPEPDQP